MLDEKKLEGTNSMHMGASMQQEGNGDKDSSCSRRNTIHYFLWNVGRLDDYYLAGIVGETLSGEGSTIFECVEEPRICWSPARRTCSFAPLALKSQILLRRRRLQLAYLDSWHHLHRALVRPQRLYKIDRIQCHTILDSNRTSFEPRNGNLHSRQSRQSSESVMSFSVLEASNSTFLCWLQSSAGISGFHDGRCSQQYYWRNNEYPSPQVLIQ